MKRIGLFISIIGLFLLTAVGLIGCGGIDTQTATEGLTNSVGDGNGPGSGNWKPIFPENNRQARRLHTVLVNLADQANESGKKYDANYVLCLNEDGKLLPNAERSCVDELIVSWNQLRAYFLDFQSGSGVYGTWASENEEEDPPDTPNPPDPPKKDPPETEDPEDDDGGGWCCYCLTCTQSIENREFAFIDLDLVAFPEPTD